MTYKRKLLLLSAALVASITPAAASAPSHSRFPKAVLLVSGLEGGSGSTIGPDGALYVPEPGAAGSPASIRARETSPRSRSVCRNASARSAERWTSLSLVVPPTFLSLWSALTSAAATSTASTAWTAAVRQRCRRHRRLRAGHPPSTPFFVPTGVQYAMQPYRGGSW